MDYSTLMHMLQSTRNLRKNEHSMRRIYYTATETSLITQFCTAIDFVETIGIPS